MNFDSQVESMEITNIDGVFYMKMTVGYKAVAVNLSSLFPYKDDTGNELKCILRGLENLMYQLRNHNET